MPEPVANTDGSVKQDCEINAAKRLFEAILTISSAAAQWGLNGIYGKPSECLSVILFLIHGMS